MLATFLLSSAAIDLTLNPAPGIALPAPARRLSPTKKTENEADLIRLAIAGNESAYATLVRRYERMVFGLAFQIVGNREDALEVAQDAFMKAFRALSGYRGESRFSTWLYRVARSSAISHLRRARRETVALDAPESPVGRMAADALDSHESIALSERLELLRQAFQRLSPDDNAVLTLFYLQEQCLEEICEVMGWTMSNAKSRLCRARQRLRIVLTEHYAQEFGDWI